MRESTQKCRIEIEGKAYTLTKKTDSIRPLDLFYQLSKSPLFPKIYWNHKEENKEYATFGKLLEFKKLPKFKNLKESAYHPQFFGGLSFFRDPEAASPFTDDYFVLPKHILEKNKEGYFLSSYSLDDSFDTFSLAPIEILKDSFPNVKSRSDHPNNETWHQNVLQILKDFEQTEASKTVLARQTLFDLKETLDPYLLLQFLKQTQKNCSFFSFQLNPESTFLGATPECLFTRKENILSTEAIAGTAPLLKQKESLHTQKNSSEFTHVTDYLNQKLSALCTEIQDSGTQEISTGTLKHIYSSFQALLNQNISDEDLINALHPTPAVCGTPKKEALTHIQALEPFNRGWYAAPIGKVSETHTQFLVGIRSCLVESKKLTLFAGCGLVKGSDPQSEWEELETKIKSYSQFLFRHAHS